MDRTCCTHGICKQVINTCKHDAGMSGGKVRPGKLHEHERIILKVMLGKWVGRKWIGFMWLKAMLSVSS